MGFSSILHTRVRKSKSIQSAALHLRGELLEYRRLLAGPSVTSLSPINTEIGVAVAAKVSVTFNEAIDPATLTAALFNCAIRRTISSPAESVTTMLIIPRRSTPTCRWTISPPIPPPFKAAQRRERPFRRSAGKQSSWSFTTAASPQTGPGGPILSSPRPESFLQLLRRNPPRRRLKRVQHKRNPPSFDILPPTNRSSSAKCP